MKSEIIYVELKTGYNDNGPAWIGRGSFNRTGQTVYFNGKAFKKGKGIAGNHFDLQTGDEYWISGVKKKGGDRHWAGAGPIQIDESIVNDYLDLRDLVSLPKSEYIIVHLDNTPAKALSKELENQSASEGFDEALKFKDIADLRSDELDALIAYYQNLDLSSIPKKARKGYIDKIDSLAERKRFVTEGTPGNRN